MRTNSFIQITGAKQHNLKNISLKIPKDKLVVITGVSGSGKSSLAFDTLYAEGQRRYVESLSAYSRQFLTQMERPEVDYIEGLSPAIAIEQRTASGSPRSIIATSTEIFDYLRLLFAHAGKPHSPITGRPIEQQTTDQIVDTILSWEPRTRIILLAPIVKREKGGFADVFDRLQRDGFVRVRVDGEIRELTPKAPIRLPVKKEHTIQVIVDRLVMSEKPAEIRTRLTDSMETALRYGSNVVHILYQRPSDNRDRWDEATFSTLLLNPDTGKAFPKPEPRHFSFNSPQGACPVCMGLGKKMVFSAELLIDPQKSLEGGAILPWRRLGKRMITYYKALLKGVCQHYNQPMDAAWEKLPTDFQKILLNGSGTEEITFSLYTRGKRSNISTPFEGILPNLTRIYAETTSDTTHSRLKAYMTLEPCDACNGNRLRPEILSITLPPSQPTKNCATEKKAIGINIMDICKMSIEEALEYFEKLSFPKQKEKIVSDLLHQIRSRLNFLVQVGLGYLTLDRESGTLSGGESQRIRLASQIGAGLTGVLYILDEPSIGLHQKDNHQLLSTLKQLRDQGNSVIVVEHDTDTMEQADWLIDMGPGAGTTGGNIVSQGTPKDVKADEESLTGRYLSGKIQIPVPKHRQKPSTELGYLTIHDASENNLKNITVSFPIGLFTCVTGVSGSGKSTLVEDILHKQLARDWYGAKETPGKCKAITGTEHFRQIVVVDQSPIGRTPRSNPATYSGILDHIRALFAKLPASKVRGFNAGRFSSNIRGGRCEKCKGDGLLSIEMNFLPPVYVTCDACGGKRYNRETLEVTYRGKNIADILSLTVNEAIDFFTAIPAIHEICLTLANVGLGYLTLGQSATTLSGGEAQRLKLATELRKRTAGQTLYILDEPTTGLHFHDVARLLDTLTQLRKQGNTIIVIEHNLDVIKSADWVIDLGPEAGKRGGEIVIEGTPEVVAKCSKSLTGKYLAPLL